ncbi:nucleotidyltransferase family protein [Mixta tenebrionis]|uniref:CBS domain-containing protein n=1 Tax=Mixta tenebrionis TaxID=2562439 RepID=A0A506VAG2_9GAMM|nr:nucleotidyltransferase family protein [Mixta tenebrionis]TPW42707.1 CBS domain-containing protein [Mixta tenebrionis]
MNKTWEKVLIAPHNTILEALNIINKEALRIALVVDANRKLLGVVTDGDIRRGLLKNLPLTENITSVMNTTPITAPVGTNSQLLNRLMEEHSILSIPLIEDNKVVGLETIQTSNVKKKYDNPVFIMAGGFGTRLRPLTNTCPKPMLKIGDKPILEITLNSFINNGFSNFYISTHFMPEVIENHFGDGSLLGVNIKYIHEHQPLGTGGALGLLPEDLADDLPLIMINGDILTNIDYESLINFHTDNIADVTVCVREFNYQVPYGVIAGENNRVKSIVEKPIQSFFVNAGIYAISPHVFKSVPKNYRIDMPSLMQNIMEKEGKVLMFPVHEYWLDIGRMDDFYKAQQDIFSIRFKK